MVLPVDFDRLLTTVVLVVNKLAGWSSIMIVVIILGILAVKVQSLLLLLLAGLDRHAKGAEIVLGWSLMSLGDLLVELARGFIESNIVAIPMTEGSFMGPGSGLHHFFVLKWVVTAQVVQILLNLPSHRI